MSAQFKVMEEDGDEAEGAPPNTYSTVCDEESRTVEVWFNWWPDDAPEPLGDPFPSSAYEDQTWLEWLVGNVGWDDVLLGGGHWSLHWPIAFLAAHGIAPTQPFCVRFSNYTSTRTRDGEYDEGWDVEVIRVESWDDARTIHAWTAWIDGDAESAP